MAWRGVPHRRLPDLHRLLQLIPAEVTLLPCVHTRTNPPPAAVSCNASARARGHRSGAAELSVLCCQSGRGVRTVLPDNLPPTVRALRTVRPYVIGHQPHHIAVRAAARSCSQPVETVQSPHTDTLSSQSTLW